MNRRFTAPLVLVGLGAALTFLGVVNSAPRSRTAAPGPDVGAITHVRVFDGERVIPRATVVFDGNGIREVGPDVKVPPGVVPLDGTGKTLLPGLVDAHVHTFGDALERSLAFGVTSVIDMFTDHHLAARMRAEQAAGPVRHRAHLLSAGTLVTAPGGHGTQFGSKIPTLASAADAQAFVDARLAEGSDFIKVVHEDGAVHGLSMPTLAPETLAAVISAARARQKLAVVHVGDAQGAALAIESGASGLVHLFADAPADASFVRATRTSGAFVIPTLTVLESAAGTPSGASLLESPTIAPLLTSAERSNLSRAFPARGARVSLQAALASTRALAEAGVPILAGSDAPNPGMAHGASLHRELELLVQAGLSPVAALTAATSAPARAFGLTGRGRIAPGMRADLLLVEGDPTRDILATRNIIAVWKEGVKVERAAFPAKAVGESTVPEGLVAARGRVSDFDEGQASARFGAGWSTSTDALRGGSSTAALAVVEGGASGSRGSLRVTGKLEAGAAYPWAGALFSPGPQPFAPADLSGHAGLAFWARGDAEMYSLMVFSASGGPIPAQRTFQVGPGWQRYAFTFEELGLSDARDVQALLFSATAPDKAFAFQLDEVSLTPMTGTR